MIASDFLHHNQFIDVIIGKSDYDMKYLIMMQRVVGVLGSHELDMWTLDGCLCSFTPYIDDESTENEIALNINQKKAGKLFTPPEMLYLTPWGCGFRMNVSQHILTFGSFLLWQRS